MEKQRRLEDERRKRIEEENYYEQKLIKDREDMLREE
jgi:hypothetical protein